MKKGIINTQRQISIDNIPTDNTMISILDTVELYFFHEIKEVIRDADNICKANSTIITNIHIISYPYYYPTLLFKAILK